MHSYAGRRQFLLVNTQNSSTVCMRRLLREQQLELASYILLRSKTAIGDTSAVVITQRGVSLYAAKL
jgi:hypothetical protein